MRLLLLKMIEILIAEVPFTLPLVLPNKRGNLLSHSGKGLPKP